jgi:hypothetical protein
MLILVLIIMMIKICVTEVELPYISHSQTHSQTYDYNNNGFVTTFKLIDRMESVSPSTLTLFVDTTLHNGTRYCSSCRVGSVCLSMYFEYPLNQSANPV